MITNRIAVVGLDVGNDSTHVALARGAKVQVLQSASGKRKTPSMVAFTDKNRCWGSEAASQKKSNFKNTITDYFQLIGLTTDDEEFKSITENFAYSVGPAPAALNLGERNRVAVNVTLKEQPFQVLPEQCLAFVLSQIKELVETETKGQTVEDCVIAVPGYWTDRERRSVMVALELSGWKSLRLMNENCALALYYGLRAGMPLEPIQVLFIDSGKSHTSLSLVEFKEGSLRVLNTAHDRTLGGRAFDKVLYDHMAADIKSRYNLDVSTNAKARTKLLAETERVKTVLSANTECPWKIEYLMNDTDVKGSMNRTTFDGLAAQLYARGGVLANKILTDSGVAVSTLHGVELVGGNTRVPGFKDALKSALNCALKTTCDSDEGVVRGSTLECANLSSSTKLAKVFKATDIGTHPIDLIWTDSEGKESALAVFKPGDNLPCLKKIPFKRKGAFTLKLRYNRAKTLVEGYKGLPLSSAVSDDIGTFVVDGPWDKYFEEYPQEKTPTVNVYCNLDRNGLAFVREAEIGLRYFKVEEKKEEKKTEPAADAATEGSEEKKAEEAAAPKAEEPKKKGKAKIKTRALTITSSFVNGFTPEQVTLLRAQIDEMVAIDRSAVERDEASNALESFVLRTKNDLERGDEKTGLRAFLTDAAASALGQALEDTENWLYDDAWEADTPAFKEKLEALKLAGDGAFDRRTAYTAANSKLSEFQEQLGLFALVATEAKYAHLSEEDKKTVSDEVATRQAWVTATQGLLTQDLTAPALVTAEQIDTEATACNNKCNPILRKKATAEEAKKVEAAEAEKKAEEDSDKKPLAIE